MCGIAGVYFKDLSLSNRADKILTTLLDRIDHRGGHACGFAALGDDGIGQWQKAAVDAKEFNRYRQPVPPGTRVLLAHTRFATQGHEGFMENNHPIRRGPFYLVHNGHVWNDDKLFEKAERHRYGQVDSESLAALIAHGDALERIGDAMEHVLGDAAIAVIDERQPRKLALARGEGSPLVILETRRMLLFASTEEAVLEAHTRHVGRIAKRRLERIDEGTLLVMDEGRLRRSTFKVTPRTRMLTTYQALPAITFPYSWSDEEDTTQMVWGRCDICDEDAINLQATKDIDSTWWMLCDRCLDEINAEEEILSVVDDEHYSQLSWDDVEWEGLKRAKEDDEKEQRFIGL